MTIQDVRLLNDDDSLVILLLPVRFAVAMLAAGSLWWCWRFGLVWLESIHAGSLSQAASADMQHGLMGVLLAGMAALPGCILSEAMHHAGLKRINSAGELMVNGVLIGGLSGLLVASVMMRMWTGSFWPNWDALGIPLISSVVGPVTNVMCLRQAVALAWVMLSTALLVGVMVGMTWLA